MSLEHSGVEARFQGVYILKEGHPIQVRWQADIAGGDRSFSKRQPSPVEKICFAFLKNENFLIRF